MNWIEDRIDRGYYPPDQPLPSERVLATELSASHETVNKAVSSLVAQGLLFRKRGIGTFVKPTVSVEHTGHIEKGIDILVYKKAVDLFHAASFHEELLFRMQRLILRRGTACNIVAVPDFRDFAEYIKKPKACIISQFLPYQLISKLRAREIPIVGLNLEAFTEGVASVKTDNRALDLLCTHLVNTGHRRIALVRRPEHSASQDLRELRFRSIMRMLELEVNTDNLIHIDPMLYKPEDDPTIEPLIQRLLSFTALVCSDDLTAIKIRGLLETAGIKIPEDISVTGFGNLSVANQLFPELTSADVDREKLCSTVVDQVFKLLNNENPQSEPLFPSFPVFRNSTAAPKN